MAISILDLFKIGIGPSSSHTVGPMRAAARFVERCQEESASIARIEVILYGSLAHTGRGHGTGNAVLLGLSGYAPDTIDPDVIPPILEQIRRDARIILEDGRDIAFDEARDIVFNKRESLPEHPNGMRFTAYAEDKSVSVEADYYSVGGGFVVDRHAAVANRIVVDDTPQPHAFSSADELLAHCREHDLSIAELVRRNESVWHSAEHLAGSLDALWHAMQSCVERGLRSDGMLPGGLKVKRRAPALAADLARRAATDDALTALDWVNLYALAVNEENAAGGRVVTAPTNGAAGIIPAVLHYYARFCCADQRPAIHDFLLTAGAVGMLYKENASISGAEVGCQGEVGVACSMAAAGLAAVNGGTPAQVEMAAEIGMEHNLGLTCDPIGGLVQIPCIERNAMGAVKAINASRMALRSDGEHFVSLDKVIATMQATGRDMQDKYKETSRGGLAVNVIEC